MSSYFEVISNFEVIQMFAKLFSQKTWSFYSQYLNKITLLFQNWNIISFFKEIKKKTKRVDLKYDTSLGVSYNIVFHVFLFSLSPRNCRARTKCLKQIVFHNKITYEREHYLTKMYRAKFFSLFFIFFRSFFWTTSWP